MSDPLSQDPWRTVDYVPLEAGSTVRKAESTPSGVAPPEDAPRIPGYVILSEIARGGMGRVYLARDVSLQREVAVKTLLPGANGDRFITEARIMARLSHPGIPPVHALGVLPDGTPYLAMKLIRGRTLAEELGRRGAPQADLPRLVQVFEQIAQAVGFAHAQGIVHRDLKPLNVMVGPFGEVQVMDWGLAKTISAGETPSLDERPPQAEGHTLMGQVVGTLGYMSPEQARGEMVDARTDVFALGSLLAVILTGKPAFVGPSKSELMEKSARGEIDEVLARLGQCGADGELVAIATRCLAPRAEERYADGQAVAAAIAAYRAEGEARLRRAESERAEALVREAEQRKRRRQAVLAGGAVAATLLVGLALTLWQLDRAIRAERQATDNALVASANERRANQERDAKAAALKAEAEARQAEQAAKALALRRLDQTEKGVDLLASLLRGINPRSEQLGGEPLYVQLRNRAEKAAGQLDGQAVGDPQAVARLQTVLGNTLRELGSRAKAVELLEKARATRERELGPDHPDTLATLGNLAAAYYAAGNLREAIRLYQRVCDTRARILGSDHPDTLNTLHDLAVVHYAAGNLPEAIRLLEQVRNALASRVGPSHPDTLVVVNNLALAYQDVGKAALAIKLYKQVREAAASQLGPEHPDTLAISHNLAYAYRRAGALQEAIRLFEQVREARARKLGEDHPDTLATLDNLASAYRDAGDLPKAIRLFEQVYEGSARRLGAEHPDTLATLNNLAGACRAGGNLAEAIRRYEQAREAKIRKLGPHHPETLATLFNLALAYQEAGRLAEATELFEQAATGMVAGSVPHPHAEDILRRTIQACEQAGRPDKAERWLRRWLELVGQQTGDAHPSYARVQAALGRNLLSQEKWGEAETVLRACVAIRQKHEPDTWTTFNAMSMLGGAVLGQAGNAADPAIKQQRLAEAEKLLLGGYKGLKRVESAMPPEARASLLVALDRLVALYAAWQRPEEAAKWQAERAKHVAPDASKPPSPGAKGQTRDAP